MTPETLRDAAHALDLLVPTMQDMARQGINANAVLVGVESYAVLRDRQDAPFLFNLGHPEQRYGGFHVVRTAARDQFELAYVPVRAS